VTIVFGTLGVSWVMVRCPGEYDELMPLGKRCLGAGCAAMAGRATPDWSVIRELDVRRAGIRLP
jgi:hypothetical protein